ncbi:HECT-type E3 ubiquitin transferase [Theileria orientalis]|uniref:HECT-type E3 ubiquitin transferase n=1 Tax=Theileria orientalis TaxID=68886 RepID=A0A976QRV0_THEOR|nr:HECT-type E3 ubiquitin transferase [Theileria orientalis]
MDESNDSTLSYDYSNPPLNISKGSNAEKWLSILSLLKNGSHSEQVMALTELSNLLSYSNEEYLLGFPSLVYIRVLFHILENPSVKYSKLFEKNTEKSAESQNMSMKFNLPYFHLLSSVYKDEKFLLDNFSKDNFFGATESQMPTVSKPMEYEGGMDLDEEEEMEPDSQVYTNKMILSASCLHTILDIIPYTSRYFAMNGNLTTLCSKLNDLEYIDLAERILLIFEKLSHEIPLSLLKKGVMYHMLQYIDFFPIEIQISTLTCVLNLAKLVDRKEYFSDHVLPILTPLCSFLQSDNKKLSEVIVAIWRELLSILTAVGDGELVSNFVASLSENGFLEKILRLILSPNMGRTLVLERMAILSSLLKLSTEMVSQFFKYDQLTNIKLLCYNHKESLQHVFIHLANNILSSRRESKCENSEEKESESSGEELSGYDEVEMVEEADAKEEKGSSYKGDVNREEFFCENVEYFASIFDLLPISELCDTCYHLRSDRHKASVIGLINNILRISNRIEKYRQMVQNTVSVSKTTEFVSTCFLQVDLKVKGALDSLLGILVELINIFGHEVVVTFHRYGINHYLARAETEELPHHSDRRRQLIELISNTEVDTSVSHERGCLTYREDSDLLFEIRNNIEVWTPYELVKNVPLNRINFVRDEESLKSFITALVTHSYTTTNIEVLWKAFLKILQHTNMYSLGKKTKTNKVLEEQQEKDTVQRVDGSPEEKEGSAGSDLENLLLSSVTKKPALDTSMTRDSTVQLLGAQDRKSRMGFEGMLRKYVDSVSVHPFNLIHTQLKLRLRPYHTIVTTQSSSTFTSTINSICANTAGNNTITEGTVTITNSADKATEEKKDETANVIDEEKAEAKANEESARLLPICVYVPCLVRVSKVEHYIKRYIEKKRNVKVSEVYLYLNEVCLGSNSQLYESICRFGGLPPKKRRNIINHSHTLKYKYMLSKQSTAESSHVNGVNKEKEFTNTVKSNIVTTENENRSLLNVEGVTLTSPSVVRLLSDSTPLRSLEESKSSDSTALKENHDPNVVETTEEEMGLKVYTLYKGGKYNFRSLLTDFSRYNESGRSRRSDKGGRGSRKMEQETIKDDSTIDNGSRIYEDCTSSSTNADGSAKSMETEQDVSPGMGYLDTSTLIEKYNSSNEMEDNYMSERTNYISSLCKQAREGSIDDTSYQQLESAAMTSKGDIVGAIPPRGANEYVSAATDRSMNMDTDSVDKIETMEMDSVQHSRYDSIELSNPILYTKMPSFMGELEERNRRVERIMGLVKYDQERISFILGEKSKFEDLLLESAFPRFPNVLSEDKKILLRVMSILANLTENMGIGMSLRSEDGVSAVHGEFFEGSGVDEAGGVSGLAVSTSLSLKVLASCSNLATSMCFGCEYWVTFVLTCQQIFSLRARTTLFKINTLGLNRNLCEFYSRVRNVTNDVITDAFDEYLFEYVSNSNMTLLDEEVKLHKVKLALSRSDLLEEAMRSFETLQNNPKLEIEYKNEVGIGSGPTLEFFTLIAEKFSTHEEPKLLEYNGGYHFPAPHKLEWMNTEKLMRRLVSGSKEAEKGNADDSDVDENTDEFAVKLFRLFSFLGKVCAYSLLDDKLFGLFFNPLFWDMVKHPNKPRDLTLETLRTVDAELADSLDLVRRHPDPSELHLTHEFHGYELFEGGSYVYVDRDNVEDYVQSVVEFKLLTGVKFQIWAFRYGFSTMLPLYSLWFFKDSELSEEIFGSVKNQKEFWTLEHLKSYIIPDHGYDLNSKTYNNLITILNEFDDYNRRQFLKFTTGAPILPREGFKSLV